MWQTHKLKTRHYKHKKQKKLNTWLINKRRATNVLNEFSRVYKSIFSLSLIGFIFIFIIYIYFFTDLFILKNLVIERTDLNNDTTAISKFFTNQVMKKHIFNINWQLTENDFRKTFTDVEKIVITLKMPDTVHAAIYRFKIWAVFTTATEQQFFINTIGKIQKISPDKLSTRIIKIIFPKEMFVPQKNMRILGLDDMLFIDQLWSKFFDFSGTLPEKVEVYRKERSIIIKSSAGFEAWLTMTKPLVDQLKKFEQVKKVVNLRLSNFTYIDLRPQNRFIICRDELKCKQNKQAVFLGINPISVDKTIKKSIKTPLKVSNQTAPKS